MYPALIISSLIAFMPASQAIAESCKDFSGTYLLSDTLHKNQYGEFDSYDLSKSCRITNQTEPGLMFIPHGPRMSDPDSHIIMSEPVTFYGSIIASDIKTHGGHPKFILEITQNGCKEMRLRHFSVFPDGFKDLEAHAYVNLNDKKAHDDDLFLFRHHRLQKLEGNTLHLRHIEPAFVLPDINGVPFHEPRIESRWSYSLDLAGLKFEDIRLKKRKITQEFKCVFQKLK